MIKVKWLGLNGRPNVPPLSRGYQDDAGIDLHACQGIRIPSMQFKDVPIGVAVQMPEEAWGMIVGRSSALRHRGIFVVQGIIDPGYRGELFAGCFNLSPRVVDIGPGDRVAQLILFANETRHHEVVWADELAPAERGLAGFGSTGR